MEAIEKRKVSYTAYTILVVAVYLFLGCVYNLWHPYWVIFFTIPIFYFIAGFIDKLINPDSPEVQIKSDVVDLDDINDDNDDDDDEDDD